MPPSDWVASQALGLPGCIERGPHCRIRCPLCSTLGFLVRPLQGKVGKHKSDGGWVPRSRCLEIVAQGVVEGAGDKRPGADEATGWAGCRLSSAGLWCGRRSRQRFQGLWDVGWKILGGSLAGAFLQASRWRLCIGARACSCVSVCLCEYGECVKSTFGLV